MGTRPILRETKGFTLIELSVVILVILLIASMVIPNVSSMKSAQEARNFLTDVRALTVRARNEAMDHGETMVLAMDETNQLSVSADAGQPDDNQQIASLSVPNGTTLQTFKVGVNDSDSAAWRVHFYSDGRSESGGFEINQANLIRSFLIRDDGSNRLLDGNYPDQTNEKWQAGDYVKRQ